MGCKTPRCTKQYTLIPERMPAMQGFRQGGYPGGGMGPTQPQQWGQNPQNAGLQMTNPNSAGTPQWGAPSGHPGTGLPDWHPEAGNPFQGNVNMGGGRDHSYGGPGNLQQQGIPQQPGNLYQQTPANAPWQQSERSVCSADRACNACSVGRRRGPRHLRTACQHGFCNQNALDSQL